MTLLYYTPSPDCTSSQEQPLQRRQMPTSEASDRAVGRRPAGRQVAEGHVVPAALLDAPRRTLTRAVPVDQQLDHQARVVGRVATLLGVGGPDRAQVQRLLHQLAHEAGQVPLRQ